MSTKIIRLIGILIIILSVVILVYLSGDSKVPKRSQIIGGKCVYNDYPGKATITNIKMTDESKAQSHSLGGPGYEGYEIYFKFETKKQIEEDWAQSILDEEYLLLLVNSWYPGEKFIKKYKIELYKEFDCVLKIITQGTCTPIIFDFKNIKRDDYFESK
jgi:hypothetical protein